MKIVTLLALMTAGAASPVAAQSFTGPRAEIHLGADAIGVNTQDKRDFGGRGQFGSSRHATDFVFGGELGFDIAAGPVVVGAYAGADYTDAQQAEGLVNYRTGRNLTAGVRAGFVLGSRALIYGRGGYSNSRVRPDFLPGADQTPFANFKTNRDGLHLGGGVEVAMIKGTYIRADYTHTLYKTYRNITPTRDFRFSRNQFVGAIGIRF